eukprot:m.42994 g.42994  ORF g.42994 m.42994 type:complete len:266 (+) comp10754_c0_seq1:105-902(+)
MWLLLSVGGVAVTAGTYWWYNNRQSPLQQQEFELVEQPELHAAGKHTLKQLESLVSKGVVKGADKQEEMLSAIWKSLMPGIALSNRVSKEWQRIGFQGSDPVTDFRGMGELALRTLCYVSQHKRDVAETCFRKDDTPTSYSYAIAGINICQTTLQLLKDVPLLTNHMCDEIHDSFGFPIALFAELVAHTWIQFDMFYIDEIARYIEEGGTPALAIMQFEQIRARFIPQLRNYWCSSLSGRTLPLALTEIIESATENYKSSLACRA